MYAIVHTAAAVRCGSDAAAALSAAGFTVIVTDTPVKAADIRGEYLSKHIHKEWCCGADEFVKLYAYELPNSTEPIVVHVDIDFIFVRPMDVLFDAILFDKDSPEGAAARNSIPIERPDTDTWPDTVDAFLTRDWPQVIPGRKPGYQAGFLVARRDPSVLRELLAIIRAGNYTAGFSRANGWGSAGYGGFVGAMAMQGLLAYYYDVVRPNTYMELNQCRFNHMGMDVLYRSQPAFKPKHPKRGMCRNDLQYCEDCQVTALSDVYSIHYTQCRKPWNCVGIGSAKTGITGPASIPEDSVIFDHCMELLTVWHSVRNDLETKLLALTGDTTINDGRRGTYKRRVFQGHCHGEGQQNYTVLAGTDETWKRIPELYD